MTTNGSQGDRSIPTGGLRIDGTPVSSIELSHERCTYTVSGEGAQAIDDYGFTGRMPLIATDKGIILREIREALAEGRSVTAQTEELGRTEFSKIGPLVLGYSEQQVLMSVGRFGLNGTLGLNDRAPK
jgi:hypothetical protein